MADVGGVSAVEDYALTQASVATADFPAIAIDKPSELGPMVWTYYKMVGTDAATTDRDTWVVRSFPDPTAAQYGGALATPLRDVHILASWQQ